MRKPDLFLSQKIELIMVEGGNNFFGDLTQVIAPLDMVGLLGTQATLGVQSEFTDTPVYLNGRIWSVRQRSDTARRPARPSRTPASTRQEGRASAFRASKARLEKP